VFNPELAQIARLDRHHARGWPDRDSTRHALNGPLGWALRAIVAGRGKRKPPEAGAPVMAVPPRGPLPLQGGAEAPLEFGD
jgi:hypothetical protein